MKRPTPPPADLEDLIAVCLELYEGRGAGAVDEVLHEHPDSADLIRERLDLLGRMGLVGEPPEQSIPSCPTIRPTPSCGMQADFGLHDDVIHGRHRSTGVTGAGEGRPVGVGRARIEELEARFER